MAFKMPTPEFKKIPLEKGFLALKDTERLNEIGRVAGQLKRMYPLAPEAVRYGIAGRLVDLDQAAAGDGMSLEEYSKNRLKILVGLSPYSIAGGNALKKDIPKQYGDGRLGDLPPMRQ